MNPLFSVVVPVYNGSNYLSEALISIQKQTYKDFECLVVDDGSKNPHEVQEIVQLLNDSRFFVYRKNNGGTASALNYGVEKAKGRFIAWLSHDDLWKEGKLESSLSHLKNDSILCTNYTLIDESGRQYFFSNFDKGIDTSTSLTLISRVLIHGSSVVIPVDILRRLGGFDVELKHTQDYDFWLRAFINGVQIVFCKEHLTIGRTHRAQSSKDKSSQLEIDSFFEKLIDEWLKQEHVLSVMTNGKSHDSFQSFSKFLDENNHFMASNYLRRSIRDLQ
jgi:glycosyltransferase involved in cell wall biosynthesis